MRAAVAVVLAAVAQPALAQDAGGPAEGAQAPAASAGECAPFPRNSNPYPMRVPSSPGDARALLERSAPAEHAAPHRIVDEPGQHAWQALPGRPAGRAPLAASPRSLPTPKPRIARGAARACA